jgi:hypothetical protein
LSSNAANTSRICWDAEVVVLHHLAETGGLERGGDVARVLAGIGQLADGAIGGVADDQGHPLLRAGRASLESGKTGAGNRKQANGIMHDAPLPQSTCTRPTKGNTPMFAYYAQRGACRQAPALPRDWRGAAHSAGWPLKPDCGPQRREKDPVNVPRSFACMDRAAICLGGGVFLHLAALVNWHAMSNATIEGFKPGEVAARQKAALTAAGVPLPEAAQRQASAAGATRSGKTHGRRGASGPNLGSVLMVDNGGFPAIGWSLPIKAPRR